MLPTDKHAEGEVSLSPAAHLADTGTGSDWENGKGWWHCPVDRCAAKSRWVKILKKLDEVQKIHRNWIQHFWHKASLFINFQMQDGGVSMMSLVLTFICGNIPMYIAFHNIDCMWRREESRTVIGRNLSETGSEVVDILHFGCAAGCNNFKKN